MVCGFQQYFLYTKIQFFLYTIMSSEVCDTCTVTLSLSLFFLSHLSTVMFGSSGSRTSTGSKVTLNVYDLGEKMREPICFGVTSSRMFSHQDNTTTTPTILALEPITLGYRLGDGSILFRVDLECFIMTRRMFRAMQRFERGGDSDTIIYSVVIVTELT